MMFRGRNYAVPQNPIQLRGLGTFTSGAQTWMSPSAGITAAEGIFTSPSTSFSSANLSTTLGLLAVPAGLILILMMMGKKGRR